MDAERTAEAVRIHEHIWQRVPEHRRSEDNRILFMGGQVAGEGGEVEEETKKFWRGDRELDSQEFRDRLGAELADVVISAYILGDRVGIDIDAQIDAKMADLRWKWSLE
jgi:NTP pyrophosphatase (non-canonical NTP hydrolase)